jgi:alpha-beta hydrolase superfamily lysophospholipase
MTLPEPLTTYLELRESTADGDEGAGLSHKAGGLFLLHVLEIAAYGEPRGGVTIVHDAGDHGARYLECAHVFAAERWAVALPDLRGHGRSEGARGHSAGIKEVVRDLASVQEHLAYRLPVAPKALIGQGLGALYALRFALERPGEIAALVLLAPRWRPAFEPPKAAGGLMKLFKKPDPAAAGRVGLELELLSSDAEQRARWSADKLVHDAITSRAAQQAAELAADLERRVAEVACPTLLLHGADDRVSDPQISRGLSGPGLEVRVKPGARHDLLHERDWRDTATEIAGWLAARAP